MSWQSFAVFWSAIVPRLANHLWQSTLFAIAAGLLTLILRKNQARTRYWLWLAASIKFLIPFSFLAGIGSLLASPYAAAKMPSNLYFAMEQAGQPFARNASPVIAPVAAAPGVSNSFPLLPGFLFAVWLCGLCAVLGLWWLRWRRVSAVIRWATPISEGREVESLRRLESLKGTRTPIVCLLSQDSLEPGIFGIFRPVLLWPAGISGRLQDAHLEAILAHEVWHVRRRDNLAAALHMLVEAIFWFHPLVWWLGARLIDERERACDEEVLQWVSAPEIYAESILKACEFCVEAPLACVSGVTGAGLKQRILDIMSRTTARKLDFGRKLVLGAAGAAAIALPLMAGVLNSQQSSAESEASANTALPKFEVASIKPDKSGTQMVRVRFTPDGFEATNIPLKLLIKEAYDVGDDEVSGAPSWVNTTPYDIQAKVSGSDVPELRKLGFEQRKRMLQQLLTERFNLKIHHETKELPVYALVVAKNGPKLSKAKPGDTYPNGIKGPDGHGGPGMMWIQPGGQVTAQAAPIASLTRLLSQRLGRTVLDKTGLVGNYDFTLQLPMVEGPAPMFKGGSDDQPSTDSAPPPDSSGPSIFTAIQEQLGLKLEAQKAPLKIVIIDHIEPPSEN